MVRSTIVTPTGEDHDVDDVILRETFQLQHKNPEPRLHTAGKPFTIMQWQMQEGMREEGP